MRPLTPEARLAAVRGILGEIQRLLTAPPEGWQVHGRHAVPLACQVDEAQRKARAAQRVTGTGQ